MTARIALVALLVAAMGGAAGTSVAAISPRVWTQSDGLPACNPEAEALWVAPVADSEQWSPGGAPPEVSLRTLASGVLEELPPAPALLSLTRVHVPPDGGGIPIRRDQIPRLFVVESGTVTVFWEGNESRLGPGESALIPPETRFSLENVSAAPAQLLRLSIDQPDAPEVPVLEFDEVTAAPLAPDLRPVPTLLFRAAIANLPRPPARFFIACASWSAPPDGAALLRHSGPVGLRMAAGRLHVDDGAMPRTLPATSCTLFDPRRSYQVEAGDEPPTAYLFGAIAEGDPLWLPGAATAGSVPQQLQPDCGLP
jgi:hypothetical protein